jgi:hypothetical protein
MFYIICFTDDVIEGSDDFRPGHSDMLFDSVIQYEQLTEYNIVKL